MSPQHHENPRTYSAAVKITTTINCHRLWQQIQVVTMVFYVQNKMFTNPATPLNTSLAQR
jgi:hypothetical protein